MAEAIDPNMEMSYAYMCGKCMQVYSSISEIRIHNCKNIKEEEVNETEGLSATYVTAELIEVDQNSFVAEPLGTTLIVNEKGRIEYALDGNNQESATQEEYEIVDYQPLSKKKRNNENNDYITNKLVRDPYFKLDRNNYTFKETLGDWSENSTKLLIRLFAKYPKAHFLLQHYYERRLSHWEQIHSCMAAAGYNFTVLQLRMRWREVFAKYRWTLNHNDLYEEKKTCEYMKEMDELFGIWPFEATSSLITLVEQMQNDGTSSRTKRIGFMTWERITELLNRLRYRYSILQVEARWRMLVTTYKSVLDHNIMPTVQPIKAAFSDRLKDLVLYEPRRRKDYEKYKGKRVKLEKFPEHGMKHLIKLYKENIDLFLNLAVKNADVWGGIQESLEAIGYPYPTAKIKEIFFATLKLYEKVLRHNSIPGAIKREGPYYKELTEIYYTYGCWPHVNRRRKTLDELQQRKFKQKLRESMQTWRPEESEALLALYPEILEKLNGHPDLWVQIAHSFQSLGFPKRDTSDIATHIGLLRQGYNQANNFPFNEQMQRLMEVEEALCCSPSVSKYTGDVEILYWSHHAVLLMLNLYLKTQPLIPFSSMSREVYGRIAKEMTKAGYQYTSEQIEEEFRNLLLQFTMRRNKLEKSQEENWSKSKCINFCKEEMKEVIKLRTRLSVGFSNGIKPIPDDILEIILTYGLEKIKEVFSAPDLSFEDQMASMVYVVREIRKHIKKMIKKKPPPHRKVCLQLLSSLSEVNQLKRFKETVSDILDALSPYNHQEILSNILTEIHSGNLDLDKNLGGKSWMDKDEDGLANHKTICIYNPGNKNSKKQNSYNETPKKRKSLSPWNSWEKITPKVELEISEETPPTKNCKYYIDDVNNTKATVISNKELEVMISIDDIKPDPEFHDLSQDHSDGYEDAVTSIGIELSDEELYEEVFDSQTLILLFENEAQEAKDEQRRILKMLETDQLERRRLLSGLLNDLENAKIF